MIAFQAKWSCFLAWGFFGMPTLALPGFPMPAQPNCPVYRSPAAVEKITYIGNNKPLCKKNFLEEVAASSRKASCKQWIQKMADLSVQNVKQMDCHDHMAGNVTFLSKTAFMTAAHRFYNDTFSNNPTRKSPDQDAQCYVDKFDPAKNMMVENNVIPNEAVLKVGNMLASTAQDYAVGIVGSPVDNVSGLEKYVGGSIGPGDEVFMASAVSTSRHVQDCFSFVSCNDVGPNWRGGGENASMHVTDCPPDTGTSGSPIWALKKDADGECTGVSIVAIQQGGLTKGHDGDPFFYTQNANDPKSMWTIEVGVNNKFADLINQVVSESQRREYSEAQPSKPSGQDL